MAVSKTCLTCKTEPQQPMRCGKCFKAYYCGRDCQTSDWPRHQKECNRNIQIQTKKSFDEEPGSASGSASADPEASRIHGLEKAAAPQDDTFPAPLAFSGESVYSLFDAPVGDARVRDFLLHVLHLVKAKGAPAPAPSAEPPRYRIPVPVIKSFPNSDYHNYPSLGVSLCYDQNKLAAIHVYPDSTSGYDGYIGPLPHGISIQDNNVAIVKHLGEPTIKGGQVVNVWIAYDNLGLQVDFTNRDWDDLNNKIACITIYKPK